MTQIEQAQETLQKVNSSDPYDTLAEAAQETPITQLPSDVSPELANEFTQDLVDKEVPYEFQQWQTKDGFAGYEGPAPEAWNDAVGSQYEKIRLTDLSVSETLNGLGTFFEQLNGLDDYLTANGKDTIAKELGFGDYSRWTSPFAYEWYRRQQEDLYNRGKEIDPVYKRYFDAVKELGLLNSDGLRHVTDEVTKKRSLELDKQIDMNPTSANIVGGIGGVFTDPLVTATMPLGSEMVMGKAAWLGKGGAFSTAGKAAFQEAKISMGTEVLVQASVYDYKDDLDLHYSVSDAIFNVASAGLGAAVLRGTGSMVIDHFKIKKLGKGLDLDLTNQQAFDLYDSFHNYDADSVLTRIKVEQDLRKYIETFIAKGQDPDMDIKGLAGQVLQDTTDVIMKEMDEISRISSNLFSREISREETQELRLKLKGLKEKHNGLLKPFSDFAEADARGFIKKSQEGTGITRKDLERLEKEHPELAERYKEYTDERPMNKGVEETAKMESEGRIHRTPDEVTSLRAQQKADIEATKEIFKNINVDPRNLTFSGELSKFDVDFGKPLTKTERDYIEKMQTRIAESDELEMLTDQMDQFLSELKYLKTKTKDPKIAEEVKAMEASAEYKRYKKLKRKEKNNNTRKETEAVNKPETAKARDLFERRIQDKMEDTVKPPEDITQNYDEAKALLDKHRQSISDADYDTALRGLKAVRNTDMEKVTQKSINSIQEQQAVEVLQDIQTGKYTIDEKGNIKTETTTIKSEDFDDFTDMINDVFTELEKGC